MIAASALSLYPVCRHAAQLHGEHPTLSRRARMLDALHAGLGSERDPFLREHYNRAMFAMPNTDRTIVADALGAIQVAETAGTLPYRALPNPIDWARPAPVTLHVSDGSPPVLGGLACYAWNRSPDQEPGNTDLVPGSHVGAIYFRGDKPEEHRSELLALAVVFGATWGVDAVTAHELVPQDGGDNAIPVTGILGPEGQAARLERFAATLVAPQPMTVGSHCIRCDQRRWCDAWIFPAARDVHHTLVPLLAKRRVGPGGKAELLPDADVIKSLRMGQSLRDLAHRIEMQGRAEFDARDGKPFRDGTRWDWTPKTWEPKPAERWALTPPGSTRLEKPR